MRRTEVMSIYYGNRFATFLLRASLRGWLGEKTIKNRWTEDDLSTKLGSTFEKVSTKMKKLVIITLSLASVVTSQGATIISSTFDGNTGAAALAGVANNTSGAGNTLTVTWTGVEAGTGSTLKSISPGGGFAIVNGGANAYSNANLAYINNNLNISGATANPRGYSFTFTPTVAYSLARLTVGAGHTNNTAADNQSFTSDLTVSISGGVFSNTKNVDYGVATDPTILPQTYDLTGKSLDAGTQYTITVTSANLVGAGAYMVYDGITLESVPEPSAALLGALGMLTLLRRRK